MERTVIALAVMAAGVAVYRLVLGAQRRQAAAASKRQASTGRSGLLVFTSPDCGPCKLQQMPIINRLMADWQGRIDLDVIDVTQRPEVASQYGVWSVPTTIVVDARRGVVAVNQGVAGERKLREQFEKASSAV